MMTTKPRLVVPYGLKTLLEGLSRAVLRIQPPSIAQFACIYFTELLQFRDANPSLDIKDLVREFQHGKVEGWQEGTDILDFKRMTPLVTEKVLRDAGVLSPLQDQRLQETSPALAAQDEMTVSLKDSIGTETSEESGIILHHEMSAVETEPSHYSCLHRDISNPLISCPEFQEEECGDLQRKADEAIGEDISGKAGEPKPEAVGEAKPEVAGEPAHEVAGEPTPEAAAEPTTEAAGVPTPEAAAELTAEAARGPTPEAAHGPTPEAARGPSTEAAHGPTPEAARGASPEAARGASPEADRGASLEAARGLTPEAAGEPTAEAAGEPTSEAAAEPTSEAAAEPTSEAAAEPTSELAAEPTPEAAAEPTPEAAAEPKPEVAGEAAPEAVREVAADVGGEAIPEAAGEPKPEGVSESAPEGAGEAKPEEVGAEKQEEISKAPPAEEQEVAGPGAEGAPGAPQEISSGAEITDADKKLQVLPDGEAGVTRTTGKTDDFSERVDRVLSKTSQFAPDSISERVERVLSKTSQKSETAVAKISEAEDGTAIEKIDKASRSSQTSISEKVDRGVSKTFKVLADNIAEKIDRMLSKTSITSEKSSDRVDRPVSKTSVTSTEKLSEKMERTISKSVVQPTEKPPEKLERTVSKTLSAEKVLEKLEPKAIKDDKSFEKAERVISQAAQLAVTQVEVVPSAAPTVDSTVPVAEAAAVEPTADTAVKAEVAPETAKVLLETTVESVSPEVVSSAYLPAQDTVVARIVRATSDTYTTLEPKLIQVEPPPAAYYGPTEPSKARMPEISKGPSMSFKIPSYEPPAATVVQDVPVCEEVPPLYIEQIPQEILVPSQKGPKQPGDYARQLRSTQFQYPGAPPMQGIYRAPADSASYRTAYNQTMADMAQWSPDRAFMEDSRYYTSDPYMKRAEDMSMRDPSGRYIRKECDQANLWTLYRLTDLNQPNVHTQNIPAPQTQSGLYFPNIQQARHQEQSMNQQYVQRNYMDTQHMAYPPMSSVRMVSSPAYVLPEEPKTKVNCPPFILVGSTIQEPHDWKPIPGHAVLSKNDLCSQRKYTTVPVPVAVSPNPMCSSLGQDMNLPSAPVYLSVAVPMDEAQRMSATQSYIHVSGEQRNMPPYVNSHGGGMSVAQAAAASRRPSAVGVFEHRNITNARSATQNLHEGRSGENIKSNSNA
ncbi:calcium-binding tyrosine phosphorylation-regulated protein [Rhinatrema bivittatum]|uniref:calcium-binding tyrosine phosphorylation-regulated protein n=1 Tax=Rhinatrema bivittatum TaxID=194408 RepID=UPI00112E3054|nr:calcium-binding tyrosine phosphorylation-regulated protein [Rhinatrema bivittatum]